MLSNKELRIHDSLINKSRSETNFKTNIQQNKAETK